MGQGFDDIELTPEDRKILRYLALHYGAEFARRRVVAPQIRILQLDEESKLREDLLLARPSLKVFFSQYAFGRRGKERDSLVPCMMRTIDQFDVESARSQRSGEPLWEAFLAMAEERNVRPNENQNRGVIQGMLELVQEIYRIDGVGSIAGWVVNGVLKTGQLEPQFMRLVDIRGLGPKNTSTYLRDLSYLFELNDLIRPAHRIHALTVDRWLRGLAPYIFPEEGLEKAVDWVLAGKAQKYARRAGVIPSLLTMGVTGFGQSQIRHGERYEHMSEILRSEALAPKPIAVPQE
ncbi:MAG: hypothetical protein KF812_03910 [Fimbriimonadaceae bacterium]|nr:hypothetical protein [Fimbriimonadaceae bacterium]